MTRELTEDQLAALRGILAAEPAIEAAALFGSAAAGRLAADSDVDVYVRLRHGSRWPPSRQRAVRLRVEQALRRDLHLVVEDLDATSVILRREVARKGRFLLEARPGAFTQMRASAMIAYADLEPWMRRCGEGVRRAIIAGVGGRVG